mgnify:CR=1 FL=1
MKKKILLVTEYLNPPYDEGIKKTVYNLYLGLNQRYELQVICRHGFKNNAVHIVKTNRLYASGKIARIISEFAPDTILYLPFQSSTFASYLRLRILHFFWKRAQILFIALQPKSLKVWQLFLVKFCKPDYAFTPSHVLHTFWNEMGIFNELVPLLTDMNIFRSLEDASQKEKLREKYNLPLKATILSHMGHLNEGRNLRSLIPVQGNGFQVVIVSSTSTPSDALGKQSLKADLEDCGIIVIDRYIEAIQELYQLSDMYLFPVVDKNSSIGLPLSILEARACGIPVISTDYGSVRNFLFDDYGSILYINPNEFIDKVRIMKKRLNEDHSKTNVMHLNALFFESIYKIIDTTN